MKYIMIPAPWELEYVPEMKEELYELGAECIGYEWIWMLDLETRMSLLF